LKASSREDFEYATPMSQAPRPRAPSSANHSQFAQEVVQDLGVDSTQASAAMSVIDKVTMITDEQLAQLDPATRKQIMQIRRELGIASTAAPTNASSSTRRSTSGPAATTTRRGDNIQHLPPQGVRNMQYYAPPQQPILKRSSSAPRQRSISSGSASMLSQHATTGAHSGRSTPTSAHSLSHSQSQRGPQGNNNRGGGGDRYDYNPHQPDMSMNNNSFTPYAAPPPRRSGNNYPQQVGDRYYDESPRQYQQQQRQFQPYNQYDDDEDDNFSQLDLL
jgi:hypothetical protein